MRTEQTLVLEREDLFKNRLNKDFLKIEFTDFEISTEKTLKNNIILFIDYNGQTKILKNRYGDLGLTAYKNMINDIFTNKKIIKCI